MLLRNLGESVTLPRELNPLSRVSRNESPVTFELKYIPKSPFGFASSKARAGGSGSGGGIPCEIALSLYISRFYSLYLVLAAKTKPKTNYYISIGKSFTWFIIFSISLSPLSLPPVNPKRSIFISRPSISTVSSVLRFSSKFYNSSAASSLFFSSAHISSQSSPISEIKLKASS